MRWRTPRRINRKRIMRWINVRRIKSKSRHIMQWSMPRRMIRKGQ